LLAGGLGFGDLQQRLVGQLEPLDQLLCLLELG
jgi:hypothetical protein